MAQPPLLRKEGTWGGRAINKMMPKATKVGAEGWSVLETSHGAATPPVPGRVFRTHVAGAITQPKRRGTIPAVGGIGMKSPRLICLLLLSCLVASCARAQGSQAGGD